MLDYSVIKASKPYQMQFERFPQPVLFCDRALSVYWSNPTAKSLYPSVCEPEGLAALLAEHDPSTLVAEVEQTGCCTVTDALPLSGIGVSLLPMPGPAPHTAGYMAILLAPQVLPVPDIPYRASRTAQALSSGMRECVSDMFDIMDAAALKADLLHAGWVKTSFARIGVSGYRVLRIADNVAEYAKFQNGVVSPQLRAVDLAGLLEEAAGALTELGRAMEVPITVTLPGAPCPVLADRALLELALFNLLHNSLYYTRAGNHVEIVLTRAGSGATLTLRDHGLGIPPEALPDLWRPYHTYRHGGRSTGLGLGLALVKAVADSCGITAALESTPGEGALATLSFQPPPLSAPLALGQDPGRRPFADRFSRLYIGLSDAVDSPYRE